LYDEEDYKEFRTKADAYKELKEELYTLDKYTNFTHEKIDSYKIYRLVYDGE
jgi:hypothetical protein